MNSNSINNKTNMAFVPTTFTSFTGVSVRPSITSTNLVQSVISTSNVTKRRSTLSMAFSSIDDPSTASTLFDDAIQSENDVIHSAYIHVFGNAYLMESERAELAVAESQFKIGKISVRELIRCMGKSEAYKKRFFSRSGPYRFVELNCKHFLGRGPISQEEISFHVQNVVNHGFEAEIDSYMDSEEYLNRFGEDTVPRFIFKGAYQRNDDFNRMMVMRKHWDGCSTSTVSGSTAPGKPIPAQLTMGHGGYVNGFVGVLKGLPAGFRPQPETDKKFPPIPANAQAPIRVRIKVAENLYQVFETDPQLATPVPAWKKEAEGEKKWNGVWF